MADPSGAIATWTVVFTDLVGSTAWRIRVGETSFDLTRQDLDRRISEVLAEHGPAVVKSTGDGVMAGFGSTASALRCAVAIQQAIDTRNQAARSIEGEEPALLRIGISVGDAVEEEGDLHGTAVVEASRLCDVAGAGAILCTGAVRTVSANRSGCRFGPSQTVELKGIPGPISVHEVLWTDLPAPGRPLTFRVLGPLAVDLDGAPVPVGGPKEQQVLALLLCRAGTAVPVDVLVDELWPDVPPRTAERTVHAYIARLRKALPGGKDLLTTVGRGYRLAADPMQLDATRFEAQARTGRERLTDGDAAGAVASLASALGEWTGPAYGEFLESPACAAEAERLAGLRLTALEDRIEAELATGAAAELVGELESLVRDHPFRERLWGHLLLALYRAGRQRDALDAYQRARSVLVDELGIEPGPELRRLEAAILDQDASLDRTSRAAPAPPPGFPLLLEAVGPAFLGRGAELDRLRGMWAEAVDGHGAFVSILGPEGMGKTRLVAEIAREASDGGGAVLYGRCDHSHRGATSLVDLALRSGGGSVADVGHAGSEGLASALGRHLPVWSSGRPVLLALDDLHLADGETLEFVAELAGWCSAAPLLVIGAFRSDGGGGSGGGSQLELSPLDHEAIAGICQLYEVQDWSAEQLREITDHTGGVPLLVHERAADLARRRTARQVERAAEQVAATRGRLDVSRGELAQGVEGIQRLVEERRRQLVGREAAPPDQQQGPDACPYKGLARFEQTDAANFFGRERLVAELVARLAESRFLAVVGPSGSGKSSLVRAGLLPALASGVLDEGTPCVTAVLSPGRHPADTLAARLRDIDPAVSVGSGRLIVFVDQFEEAFTISDRTQVPAFLDAIEDLARRRDVSVVIAVRADQFGRFATHAGLAALLDGNDVLVGPMTEAELRRTVELPAQQAGLTVEPGLVDLIVGEVTGRAGSLPLLSTALAETWDRREGRALTLAGLRAAGGVRGAVARLAEDAYLAIPASARPAGRRLLLRLCDAGDDGTLDLRRRLPIDEAVEPGDLDGRAALDVLASRRLLTIDADTVEIAHEAVLREWPRLRAWLEEDVQGRMLHRRLGDAAHAWEGAERDPSELLRGTRLDGALEWADDHGSSLNSIERAYLAASRAEAERELVESEQRAAERQRTNQRLRRMLSGVAALLVVALAAGTMAVVQRGHAGDARAVAETRTRELTLQNLVSQSRLLRSTQRDLAALLALVAHDLEARSDNFGALLGTFTADPSLLGTTRFPVEEIVASLVLPGEDRFAVADSSLAISIVERGSGDIVRSFPPLLESNASPLGYLAAYPDGSALAVSSASVPAQTSQLQAYDLTTGENRFDPVRVDFPIGAVAVDPVGDVLAVSGGTEGRVQIRSARDGSLLLELVLPDRPAAARTNTNSASLDFLADGSLAVGTMSGSLVVFDPHTGAELRRLDGPIESANFTLASSADGEQVFGTGPQGAAGWDLRSGSLLWSTTELYYCNELVVAEHLGQVLCGVPDGSIASLDRLTGARQELPFELQGSASGIATADDDGIVLLIGIDGVVAEWSLDGGGAIRRTITYGPGRRAQEFLSPNAMLTNRRGAEPTEPDVVDTVTGEVLDPLDGIAGAISVVDAPGVLAVLYDTGASGFYDLETRSPTDGPRAGITDDPAVPPLVPTGAISLRGRLVVWDDRHLQIIPYDAPRQPAVLVPTGISWVAATPDGQILYSLENGSLVQRDAMGQPTGRPPIRRVTSMVVSDGYLVTAHESIGVRRFDPVTLEPAADVAGTLSSVASLWTTRDGDLLMLGASDLRLQLADVETGTILGDPIDPGMVFEPGALDLAAILAPDGMQLAYETFDGAVIWQLEVEVLAEAACRVAGRDITEEEWATYVGDVAPYRSLCP